MTQHASPTTTTTTVVARGSTGLDYFKRPLAHWLFAAVAVACGLAAWAQWRWAMDGYEQAILVASVPALIALGWFWPPLQRLMLGVGAASVLAAWLYQWPSSPNADLGRGLAENATVLSTWGDIGRAEQVFLLKYFLSSQSAILWMSVLCFLATIFYWIALFSKNQREGLEKIATGFTWAAVALALIGTLVRWFESYLMGPDVGHIPVSNLYEVFVMFIWMTALFYLYYEQQYATRALGGFVMLIVSAAVGFLLWYTVERQAHEIQPLVPALQSWWMKLHVPANFIGYGTFALAAMVAFAWLVKHHAAELRWYKLAPLWILGIILCFEPVVFRQNALENYSAAYWMIYFGVSALIVGGILAARQRIAAKLPKMEVLEDLMYKSIAVGFAFFTIATVLGALWAAEAWGGYWSWDPKETWALIVWLNYASWLHLRLLKVMRGPVAAWWALIGLAITTFAFLGVNIFLSGLHSYGEL